MKININDQSTELVTKYCNELSMSQDDFVNHCIIDYSLPVSPNFVYCQKCSKSLLIKSLHPVYEGVQNIKCPHCNHTQDYDFNLEKWIGSNQHRIDLGKRIKELRESKGWTQLDLCDKAGLSQQSISKIEKGLFSPGLDIINRIAEALGARLILE